MKRTFLILGICAIISACGGNATNQAETGSTTEVISADTDAAAPDSAMATETPAAETPAAEPAKEEPKAAAAPVEEKKEEPKKEAKKEAPKADADIEAGKALIAQSDCMACHKLDAQLVGPAYNAVAKKYPSNAANIEKLADKIINGGSGAWGEVPMSPHASLSKDDAKKMVKYILTVK